MVRLLLYANVFLYMAIFFGFFETFLHSVFDMNVAMVSSVCNFQSMKSPVELNSLFSKFFGFITWLTWQWTTCKRGLNVKSYCFCETIGQRFRNYKPSCEFLPTFSWNSFETLNFINVSIFSSEWRMFIKDSLISFFMSLSQELFSMFNVTFRGALRKRLDKHLKLLYQPKAISLDFRSGLSMTLSNLTFWQIL